ncbi:hypothetical protein FRC14_001423 [Serendipita sp. 396]|nr:hypothetical protein FRC14_001423 [Serendipita sp. 396]KAG8804066.1 hypothetical protein FRC16_000935 [Serendipita sp. 398]KAG8828796.1 hypothetical protein FRC19_000184 [Serendipita sp. 401]KAG8836529.1 hypothetical protein FRC18_011206 [Serendipita sp. 400]KAG8876508.1 hypothetical protein FRC20_001408 [Serendipita sp. 405]KAG9058682.1 hypothetical protein FS842_006019 [Serendipita sp. 407]
MSRRQSFLNVLNGSLDPVSAALWGFEGLPEALATIKMADATLSDPTVQNNHLACEGRLKYESAAPDCDLNTGEAESVQNPLASTEHVMSLSDLWADPHGRDTLIGLDFQFSKIWEANTSRLTLQDYTQLYKANFVALNEIIASQDTTLVERIRAYQRREEMENLQRMHMEEMRQIQEPPFDPEYSSRADARNHGIFESSRAYGSTAVDPFSQLPRDDGRGISANALPYYAKRYSSPASHIDPLHPSLVNYTLEDAPVDPERSGVWPAPHRDFPALEVLDSGHSQRKHQLDNPHTVMGQSKVTSSPRQILHTTPYQQSHAYLPHKMPQTSSSPVPPVMIP